MKTTITRIEKLIEFFSAIRHDYLLHFFYGVIIFVICDILFTEDIASIIVVTIAVLKEIYDYFSPEHNFDLWDLFFNVLPIPLLYLSIYY